MQKVRTSLLDTKCSGEVKLSLAVAIKDLDIKIDRFSQELLQYKNVESTWRTDYWETPNLGTSSSLKSSKLRTLCTLANVKITSCLYQSKQTPKWQISNGSGPSQLQSPVSLAIHHSTDGICVSDLDGMRIQVFSPEGEHNQLFDMVNNGPLRVFSVNDSIFAYNTKENAIFEFKDSMSECSVKYSCNISLKKVTPALHGSYYSIREHMRSTLSVFCRPQEAPQQAPLVYGYLEQASSFEKVALKERESISLNITPVDIVIYRNSIFLLSSQGGDLVYKFNLKFVFVRSFFSCPTMKRPLAMCVDRKGNIIVAGDNVEPILATIPSSDSVADSYSESDLETAPINQSEITKLFVLSQEGDVIIHEMDVLCKNCIGVAVNSKFDIFLLNKDDKYVLSSL